MTDGEKRIIKRAFEVMYPDMEYIPLHDHLVMRALIRMRWNGQKPDPKILARMPDVNLETLIARYWVADWNSEEKLERLGI